MGFEHSTTISILFLLLAVLLAALPEDEPKSAWEELVCGIWFGKVASYGLDARGLLNADDKGGGQEIAIRE